MADLVAYLGQPMHVMLIKRFFILSALLILFFTPMPYPLENQTASLMSDYNRAWGLMGRNETDEGLLILKEIISKDKTFYRAYREIAAACGARHRLCEEAERYFYWLLDQDPYNGWAYYGLGPVYYYKQDYNRAREQYKKCSQLLPEWHECYSGLAEMMSPRPNDSSQAIEELKKIVEANPNNPAPYLALGMSYWANGQGPESVQAYSMGLEKAREHKDIELEGALLQALGSDYRAMSDYKKALEYHKQALVVFERIGCMRDIYGTLDYIGHTYLYSGNYEQALEYYRRSLEMTVKVDHKRGEADSRRFIGQFHSRLGNHKQALEYFTRALEIFQQLDLDDPKDTLDITILLDIGGTYKKIGDYPRALDYFQQAYRRGVEKRNEHFQAYALRAIGVVYLELGEYSKALDYQNRSVKIMQAIGDHHIAGATLGNIGIIYQHLGDHTKSKEYYEQSLNSARRYNDPREQERNLDNLGDLYLQIGDYDKALRYLQEALSIANVIDEGKSLFKPSILLNMGNAYQQSGEYQKALEYTQRALEVAKAREMRLVEGDALNSLADIYFKTGQISDAEERFKEALVLGEQTGISRVIWQAHRGLGQVLEAEGKYLEAEEHYKAAVDAIETIRSQLQRPEDKSTFLESQVKVYERMIRLLFRLHRREPTKGYDRQAFHYAERGRARAFLDTLAESKAGVRKRLSAEQIKRQTSILNEISKASSALLFGKPEAEKKQWQAELKKAEDRLAEFSSEIRTTNPEYAALKYPEPYDVEKVRSQVLSGDTVLIEYALGDEQSYVWMLTKDRLKMTMLPKRSEIEKQVTRYRKMITVRPKGKKAFHEYYSQARTLYEMLLGPIQEHLAIGRRLIIVPDGILYYLPFETLVKKAVASRKKDLRTPSPELRATYLIEDHVITYAPSASLLGDLLAMRAMVKPSNDEKMELLAYGDPVFSHGQKTAGAMRRNSAKSRLGDIVRGIYEGIGIKFSPLPNTREEVESIAALYPPRKRKIYVESHATESSVKQEKLSAYKRLHFATHAVIDEQVPTRSGIVLSLVNTGEEDGILQMNEIFNLELAADLVVLSACQTGLGKMVRGEGVVGLTRAFIYAGASSVAVSLWEVNDLSTSEFMKAFYKKMKEGKRRGSALREAKLEMIHSDIPAYQHPYFWAPFVLIGAM